MHPRKITIKALEKNGYEFKREFYDKGFKRKELPNRYLDDRLPNTIATTCTTIHKQERQSQSSGTTSMKMI